MSTARAVRLIDLVCRRVEAGARRHRPTSDLWPLRAQVVDLHSPESFLPFRRPISGRLSGFNNASHAVYSFWQSYCDVSTYSHSLNRNNMIMIRLVEALVRMQTFASGVHSLVVYTCWPN